MKQAMMRGGRATEIRRLIQSTTLICAFAVIPISASAQEPAEETQPQASVVSLVEDIAEGRLDMAKRKISRLESLAGNEMAISDRTKFVEHFSQCEQQAIRAYGGQFLRLVRVDYECPDGVYQVTYAPETDEGNPYVAIVDVLDAQGVEDRNDPRKRPLIAPPPPPMIRTAPSSQQNSPEELAKVREAERALIALRETSRDLFGQAVVNGDLQSASAAIAEDTRFMYGTRDLFFSTDIIDLDGSGLEAGQSQISHAREEIGVPQGVECESEGSLAFPTAVCRWQFDGEGHGMFALLQYRYGSEKLSNVQFYYVTQERTIDMLEAAAAAGMITE
jgi:hypothetical protein